MPDRKEFSSYFKTGDLIPTGGNRTKFKIEKIEDEWIVIQPTEAKGRASHRLTYGKIGAVIDGFAEVDPNRIVPTIHSVLTSRGQPEDYTNETYLYGIARAYIERSKFDNHADEAYPEEIPDESARLLIEGAKKKITINAYERDPSARRRCIERWGNSCAVCGFNFGKRFGSYGDGFIHVHHLTPLAQIGREYQLNPEHDLRPVCPNCHAMLHHSTPALSIEELRKILQ